MDQFWGGGRGPLMRALFGEKVCENKRIGSLGVRRKILYVDPPMYIDFGTYGQLRKSRQDGTGLPVGLTKQEQISVPLEDPVFLFGPNSPASLLFATTVFRWLVRMVFLYQYIYIEKTKKSVNKQTLLKITTPLSSQNKF